MEIYKPNGDLRIDVNIDAQTRLIQKITGEDKVDSTFTLLSFGDILIGDYILVGTKKYTILKEPSINKIKTNSFQYKIEFESDQYRYSSIMFLLNNEAEFDLVSDLEGFAELLVDNLNRVFGDDYFSIDSVPEDTETKNITFTNLNCLDVLQKLADEFQVEYSISDDGKEISYVDKLANDTGLVFQFKQGLRNINRLKVPDKNLVTKLYPFGSTRNITNEYGGKRLSIAPIERNIDLFGTHEAIVNFEDVYPRKNGVITSATDKNKFIDTSMDFDLNDQLIAGVTAKIVFNTGDLAGYEFEIASYDHSTKEFDLIIFEDETGLILPNTVRKVNIGDKYVLLDIKMPQVYITNAESLLLEKANLYMDQNSYPSVVYEIKPDVSYFRENLINLKLGDVVKIIDNDFKIDVDTRIISVEKQIINPYEVVIKVGDKLTVGYLNRVISDTLDLNNQLTIERQDRSLQYNQIRRRYLDAEELRASIFDNDGYFDMDKIRPLSVETSMLSVGTKGDQFLIRNLLVKPNYNANPNVTIFGDGTLVHFSIDSAAVKEWNITGSTKTHADSSQYYYIYARCVRSGSTADWLVTSVQYNIDAGTTYWYFLVGVVHSVVDNVRAISLTYGQTTINGKFITTGKISSSDGWNFIDLDNNKIVFGDADSYLDWNNRKPGKLVLNDAEIDNSLMAKNIWAEEATIGDWRIKDGKISSVQEFDGQPITQLDGNKGEMNFRTGFKTYSQSGYLTSQLIKTLRLNAEEARIEARHVGDASQKSGVSYVDSEGIFANFAGTQALPISSGIELKSAIVGLGYGKLNKSAYNNNGALTGVFGRAENDIPNGAPTFGGYFLELMVKGLHLGVYKLPQSTTSYHVGRFDTWITCYNTNDAVVYLPAKPQEGRMIFVKRVNDKVTIQGNGNQILKHAPFSSTTMSDGDCWMFVWDGSYWCAQILFR